jgi:chemotaxis protein methyltransferase CheR
MSVQGTSVMERRWDSGWAHAAVSDPEFHLFQKLIYEKAGISLKDGKRTMVSNRLRKRLEAHGFSSYQRYYDFITRTDEGRDEIRRFVNCLTTNETYFFRHPEHFDWLAESILPECMLQRHRRGENALRMWSAACSSGEEPYSIAITLLERNLALGWEVSILGTDINSEMIDKASRGWYSRHSISRMPSTVLNRHFRKSADGFELDPDVRRRVQLRTENLLNSRYHEFFDVVFCRNVLIYFNDESKNRVLANVANAIRPGGVLILGYAESLIGKPVGLQYVMPTIYRKPEHRAP